eukprot:g79302.t1
MLSITVKSVDNCLESTQNMEPTQTQNMKPILTPPDDTGHEGGENANSSANKPKVGDEVPAQPDEMQKSIDDVSKTTVFPPFFQGKTNTVFGVKDLSFHIDDDEHKTRTPHSVLVTNMTRHGWSKPLQPFTEPVSCLVFKGAKQVSAGWIVAIIWYQRKLNRQLGIYMKCTDFEVLVATDDNEDSLGISLKDYHFSAVREDLPLKPLPAEWKLLSKKEILSHLIEKALERRSADVGPGALQSADKAHQMQAWSKFTQKETEDLTSRLAASQALVASFEAALHQERERVASLSKTLAQSEKNLQIESKEHNADKEKLENIRKRLESDHSALTKKRKLLREDERQYKKLEADLWKEQDAHEQYFQKNMKLQEEDKKLKEKVQERGKKIKTLEKLVKDLQGEVNRLANACLDPMHRAFATPSRSSQNRTEFSLLRMPHSHSQAPPYMGSLTFASHMGSPSTAALTPEISVALTPDFRIRNPVAKLLE